MVPCSSGPVFPGSYGPQLYVAHNWNLKKMFHSSGFGGLGLMYILKNNELENLGWEHRTYVNLGDTYLFSDITKFSFEILWTVGRNSSAFLRSLIALRRYQSSHRPSPLRSARPPEHISSFYLAAIGLSGLKVPPITMALIRAAVHKSKRYKSLIKH